MVRFCVCLKKFRSDFRMLLVLVIGIMLNVLICVEIILLTKFGNFVCVLFRLLIVMMFVVCSGRILLCNVELVVSSVSGFLLVVKVVVFVLFVRIMV